ncbi:MAG TPA: DUF4126 domain-containing protein [Candidatus Polarisedimenticolaceae bacterium]|nr:DUF4126 domain-containing protein [Candidatus Polarisedimenticolaceae bacterium]
MDSLGQIALGLGLAATAGLRTFLPLFALGAGARAGMLPLAESWQWLASTPALVIFGAAVIAELLADKIPAVDHLLDLLGLVLKPAAAVGLVAAAGVDLGPLGATVLGILAGAPLAGGLHLLKAKTRLASSALTLGLANPLISLIEDGLALGGVLVALVLPLVLLAATATALLLLVAVLLSRSRRRLPSDGCAVLTGTTPPR